MLRSPIVFASRFFPLAVIILLALLLRLPHLTGSFWLDEAAQALESTRPLTQQLDIVADFQPPLLHLITHFASYISLSEWWLRSVGALIPGLLTISFIYLLLLQAANKKTAIIATLLLATSSLHIFFSQELRPYSLPALFTAASWWALYNKRWRWFIVATILGLYSSYLYPFLLIAQFAWQLLILRKKPSKFLIALAISSSFFLPWLPMFFAQLKAGQILRHSLPGWESAVSIPQPKALQLVLAKFIFGLSNLSLSPIFVLIAAIVIIASSLLIFSLWPRLTNKKRQLLSLLIIWASLPLLLSWLASWIIPVVRPKRLLLSLGGFYGLMGYLLFLSLQAKSRLLIKIAYLLISMLFLLNVWSTAQYYSDTKLQREDWRSVIARLEKTYPSQQTLALFIFPEPFAPWRWYADAKIATLSTKSIYIDKNSSLRDLLEPTLDYDYIIMFDYLQDLTDPNRLVTTELEKFGFQETGSFSADNLGFVRIYSKKNTITSKS